MEENLKRIKNIEDLAIELLGIFKDGVMSRIVMEKTKPLTYSMFKLQNWATKDAINIGDIQEFLDICNKYIADSSKNYEIIGKLKIKKGDIVSSDGR